MRDPLIEQGRGRIFSIPAFLPRCLRDLPLATARIRLRARGRAVANVSDPRRRTCPMRAQMFTPPQHIGIQHPADSTAGAIPHRDSSRRRNGAFGRALEIFFLPLSSPNLGVVASLYQNESYDEGSVKMRAKNPLDRTSNSGKFGPMWDEVGSNGSSCC